MTYGLIGYPLTHSFSKKYFTEKFSELGLADSHRYLNFPMEDIREFCGLRDTYPDLMGCNVTIPHKETVIPLVDELDPVAARIGAVNCIRFTADGKTTGFNTDYLGFQHDFLFHLQEQKWTERAFGLPWTAKVRETSLAKTKALVLGTGGASLAVHEALRELGVTTTAVSRTPGSGRITYKDLTAEAIREYLIVINTTPLGTFPNVNTFPDLPYGGLTTAHFCYDLVYNPPETAFLNNIRAAGAAGANGMGMLQRQAEAGWSIWQAT